ncbi:hypothetical protein TEA_011741 [Camellia sinensis var. sinensis]|uniref:Uncharacterized protein n=1 Tax=Camellia sinensis var. sinensis TaxID=542762 RepID=A0A4S4DH26_CAMSN|nr:hypothetical protein TEA_011741 [Camellia sinensis var. sinensis]
MKKALLFMNCTLLALGNSGGPILLRLCFLKGEKRIWLSSFLETAGWPFVIFPILILSNGRYKSVVHRAVVNNKATRISIAMPCGPSLNTIVSPAPELVEDDEGHHLPAYIPMKYRDYLELQQSNQLGRKSCLDRVRLQIA